MNPLPHISVSICTYQRPQLLDRLLQGLAAQVTDAAFTYSVIITDNDPQESARATVTKLIPGFPVPLVYATEPRRSISHARNKGLGLATGDYVAFIDDDEYPQPDWLAQLLNGCRSSNVQGVLGPVRPEFPAGTPTWVQRGGFFFRPEHPTGFVMPWPECRTGNVLLDRRILQGMEEVFNPVFGTGGSDVDFFRRMITAGHVFIWCNEAVVHEVVPPSRWKRSILLKRALLRGQNASRRRGGRLLSAGKSLLALPLYLIAAPVLLLAGHHLFMRYMVKSCDHLGKLLGYLGIRPIKARPM